MINRKVEREKINVINENTKTNTKSNNNNNVNKAEKTKSKEKKTQTLNIIHNLLRIKLQKNGNKN